MYTLGIPSYANTSPLFHFLQESETLRIRKGVPTELNKWLLEGSVDLSLVSSYFYLQNQDTLKALPDYSVSNFGSVYSVNLFLKKPLEQTKTVALTDESATSIALLKHWLASQKVEVDFTTIHGGLELIEDFDGVMLIGDKALKTYVDIGDDQPNTVHKIPKIGSYKGLSVEVIDLAHQWFELYRLPFVFAVWATHQNNPPPPEVMTQIRAARSRGLGNLAEVARFEAQRIGISEKLMQHYLWNFRYHLEQADREGLAYFSKTQNIELLDNFWNV